MKEVTSAGGVVVGPKRKIVLVFQHSDTWGIPKGHVENGETVEQTAIREIEEETGLTDLKFIKKLGVVRRLAAHTTDEMRNIHLFLFKTTKEKLNSTDVDEPQWFTFEEAVKKNSFREEKAFLLEHKKEILGD